jgi:hypothetical protein
VRGLRLFELPLRCAFFLRGIETPCTLVELLTYSMTSTGSARAPLAPNFVGLSRLNALIKTVIWSGMVEDEEPVSAVIIAPPESAKTELLKQFRGTRTLEFFADLTSRGLSPYKADIENQKLRHIVILDLIRVLSHPRVTADRTIQTLAGLIEEGQSTIADAGGIEKWGDTTNLPRIGALMAVTPQVYRRKRKMFRDTGFLSRFLPIHYDYSAATVKSIHLAIQCGHKKPEPTPVILPEKRLKAKIPDKIAPTVTLLARNLGERSNTWGFRWHRSLRSLLKATALSNGRMLVNYDDYDQLTEWTDFFDPEGVTL